MICRREKEGRSEEEGKNEERQIQMILEAHFLEVVFPFAKSMWRFPVKGPCPRDPSMVHSGKLCPQQASFSVG